MLALPTTNLVLVLLARCSMYVYIPIKVFATFFLIPYQDKECLVVCFTANQDIKQNNKFIVLCFL